MDGAGSSDSQFPLMNTTRQIDHVAVVVADLAAAEKFATEVLGLELDRAMTVSELARKVAFYHCGPARIEFIEDLDPNRKAAVLGGRQAVIEHLAIRVGDLDETLAHLSGHGVRPDQNGVLEIGGRRSAWTDPDTSLGVILQLLGTPPATG